MIEPRKSPIYDEMTFERATKKKCNINSTDRPISNELLKPYALTRARSRALFLRGKRDGTVDNF